MLLDEFQNHVANRTKFDARMYSMRARARGTYVLRVVVPNMVPKIDKIVNFQFNNKYYMMDARKDLRRDPIDIWLKSAFSLVHHA